MLSQYSSGLQYFPKDPNYGTLSPALTSSSAGGGDVDVTVTVTQTIIISSTINNIFSSTINNVFSTVLNNGVLTVSASGGSVSSGNVIFFNSNNVSFGMLSGVITASADVDTAGLSFSSLSFDNANGITFGIDGSTLTASHNGLTNSAAFLASNYTSHTHSQYINTSQSSLFRHTSANSQLQFTSQMTAYLGTTYTTHTHSQSGQALSGSNGSFSFQTASFGDLNGITFYTSNGSMVASLDALTSQSGQAFDAGGVSSAFETLSFEDANGISFSNNAGAVLVTHDLQYSSNTSAITSAALHTSVERVINVVAATNSTGGGTASISGDVSFSNANGVSFYTSAGGAIVASHNALTSQSNQALSGSNGAFTFQTATFGNLNGLSFYSSNGSMVGSYTVPTQTNQAIGLYASSNTTAQSSSSTVDARSITFRGAGIASVGLSAGEMVISVPAGVGQTGISGVLASDATYSSGTISFRDGNGISFASTTGQGISLVHGLQYTSNTSAITANALNTSQSSLFQHTSATSAITSAALHTSAARIQGIIGSNTTYTSGSVGFRDLNGITWQSTTGQSFQITHDLQYTSNTSNITSNALHSSASRVFNIVAATNSTGGGTASLSSNVSFSNANNFTFYTSAGGAVVASFSQSNQTVGLYASSQTTGQSSSSTVDARSISIRGMGNISVGLSGGEYIISGSGGVGGGVVLYDGANSISTGTARFTNANGVSFTFNGQTISGSVETSYAASNHSHGNPTLALTNINGTTASNSNGLTLSLSVAPPGAAAENNWVNLLGANTAGNTTASGSTIGYSGINLTLSGTNNSVVNISAPATSSLSATGALSISTNGSTISIGVPNNIYEYYNPYENVFQVTGQRGAGTLAIRPITLPNISFDRMVHSVQLSHATNSTGSLTVSYSMGFYTRTGSSISLYTSFSNSAGITYSGTANTTAVAGWRQLSISGAHSISGGAYWMGMISSTSTSGANASLSNILLSQLASGGTGVMNVGTATSGALMLGLGNYSTSTAALPNTIAFSQIVGTATIVPRFPMFYFVNGSG